MDIITTVAVALFILTSLFLITKSIFTDCQFVKPLFIICLKGVCVTIFITMFLYGAAMLPVYIGLTN